MFKTCVSHLLQPSQVTRLALSPSPSPSPSSSLLQSPLLRPAADVDSNTFRQQLNYFVSPQMLKFLRCWLQFLTAMLSHLLLVLCIVGFSHSINSSPGFRNGGDDRKNLIVGEELWKETIPLQLGSRVYELQGLKSHTWYEVKISYPASIPASFTIQLKKDDSDPGMNRAVRKLLNTEKLIFKSDVILDSNQSKLCVLVRVEPEGVVAIPNVKERKDITFNIVCDELLLGIPHKAWWVVVFVLLCLGVAFILPHFLPSYLLLRDRRRETSNQSVSKES